MSLNHGPAIYLLGHPAPARGRKAAIKAAKPMDGRMGPLDASVANPESKFIATVDTNIDKRRSTAMPRTFEFDVDAVVKQLNRILEMELASVIYYTHYSFMIYGHARIPITEWLRDNATESLAHAQEAGQMIMRLHKRPALGIGALPTTQHNTIDDILAESIEREETGVELYRELLSLVKDKSVVLEEYATRLVSKEAVHLREMELMSMKRAPE